MQFIKTYENALPSSLITELISWADDDSTEVSIGVPEDEGSTQFPDQGKLGRNDHQKFLKYSNIELMKKVHFNVSPFIEEYMREFPLSGISSSHEVKLQKTPIGGGFSPWHSEQGNGGDAATRVLAWMVYLNTVEEGGDTEFVYQAFKQKAVEGTLVIWPATYTHPHRGNPPYSSAKYVITGWTNFSDGV